MNYKTPGVYIEEISSLPPSVAAVSTAVPAFIGYTQYAVDNDKSDLTLIPKRISTLLEYEQHFGSADLALFSVAVDADSDTGYVVTKEGADTFLLYYALKMYFDNGGGSCYIVSAGNYSSGVVSLDGLQKALDAVALMDEPTLLVMPDATSLPPADYYALCGAALNQCNELQDRFAIFDLLVEDKDGSDFRNGTGSDYLRYGAVYTPWLKTTLTYQYDESSISISGEGLGDEANLSQLKTGKTNLYNQVKLDLASRRITLPPSAAMAGVYARVDRDRGVWKAPANVSINSVIEPEQHITNKQQDNLNVDPDSGKSINVIRSFTGRGPAIVWGARTLAGNDNEWRYINVRRLFNFIEESVQKATSFAVFEPNTATTWLKVKGMIEGFLFNLWEQGALAGATAEAAYYVQVGLGKTMTPQDILEGKLIVEVGIAASRPAEFIVLRFTHKLQES